MLLSSNILLTIINAVTFRRESLFTFTRVAIMIFLTGSLAFSAGSGLEIYNGLFHSTVTTQSFDLFIHIIGAMILLLTGFSPRCKMTGYPLIILFTLAGSIALMSSSDYPTISAQSLDLNLQGVGVMALLHPGHKGFGSPGKRFIRTSAKAHLTLSPELKEVIVGSMLGDLSSERPNSKCNTRMQFKQSVINREYLLHLYSLFSDYCGSSPLSMSKFDSRPNKMKEYHAIKFQTLSLPCFNVYRDMFYPVKPGVPTAVKIIPNNLGELLTARGLAYLLMDDGYRSVSGVYISTESFTLAENEFLADLLRTKFELDCSVHAHTNGHRIYIFGSSSDRLISLVKPYFVKEFYYKLGL